jgi:hypothetical protein
MVKFLALLVVPTILAERVKRHTVPDGTPTGADWVNDGTEMTAPHVLGDETERGLHHHHGHRYTHMLEEDHNPSDHFHRAHSHTGDITEHTHGHEEQHGTPHDHILVDTWYNTRCRVGINCEGYCNINGFCVTMTCTTVTCRGTCDHRGMCLVMPCTAENCDGSCGDSNPYCYWEWSRGLVGHHHCNNHNCPGTCYGQGHHSEFCIVNTCNEATCTDGYCKEGYCIVSTCTEGDNPNCVSMDGTIQGKCHPHTGTCVIPLTGHPYYDPDSDPNRK